MDHVELGNMLIELGQFADAERELCTALAADPNDALAHALLGTALCNQGRLTEARRETKLAMERDPTLGYAFYAHCVVLMRDEETLPALKAIAEALRLEGEHPEYLYIMACLCLSAERPAEALEVTRRALVAHPGHAPSIALRSQLLASLDRSEEPALTLGEALAGNPRNAAGRFSNGISLLVSGDNAAALENLLAARRLEPHLALVTNAIALAVGRQMIPFRWLGRLVPYWYRWPLVRIWALFLPLLIVTVGTARYFPAAGRRHPGIEMRLCSAIVMNACMGAVFFDFCAWFAARVFKQRIVGRLNGTTLFVGVLIALLVPLIEINTFTGEAVGCVVVVGHSLRTMRRLSSQDDSGEHRLKKFTTAQ